MDKPVASLRLVVLVAALIYAVLGLAELGTFPHANVCGLQFPLWFGCVLSSHQSLAGGLIAAAGALLAARLAARLIWEQMALQRADMAARELQWQQSSLADTEDHIRLLERTRKILEAVLHRLDAASEPWPALAALLAAYRDGLLQYAGGLDGEAATLLSTLSHQAERLDDTSFGNESGEAMGHSMLARVALLRSILERVRHDLAAAQERKARLSARISTLQIHAAASA